MPFLPIIPTPARSCLVLLFLAAAACGGGSGRPEDRAAGSPAATPSGPPQQPASSSGAGTILAVGTSLTAGLGLDDPDQAWSGLVQKKIDAEGLPFRVVNAGVSGETSAGAQRRIDWLLRQPVSVFILETGANDALRGQDPAATRANIEAILESVRAKAPQAKILILGMRAPPNLGVRYTTAFEAVYPELARKHGAALVPFVLDGVAGVASLNQADGVHPTPEGHRIMAETVWRALRPLL